MRSTKQLAFLWGISEATFFFIVPDVLLTYIAINNPKKAFQLMITTLIGAVIGGVIIMGLGYVFYEQLSEAMIHIPAISKPMVASVDVTVMNQPLIGMIKGAFMGIPYKLFALSYGNHGVSMPVFIVASLVARTLRFSLTIIVAGIISNILRKIGVLKIKYIHSLFWVLFYGWYFFIMS